MEELERTYLAKRLPDGLAASLTKEVADNYVPGTSDHPVLRIRKNGDEFEITKKYPIKDGDASRQVEMTIPLTLEEYTELNKLPGKRVRKIRHYFEHSGKTFEIDVFQDALAGLVLVDIEFGSVKAKEDFVMPDFCLVEVTQEKFLAGGMLCGKSYSEIRPDLAKFSYQVIDINIHRRDVL